MSSRYDCVLDILLNMCWKFEYNLGMQIMLIRNLKFDVRDDPILQNSSQEPSMSSNYDCILDALLIMLGRW